MKKNFLIAVAFMVAAFFVATEIAQAADVTFSGQVRTRYEINEQSDFADASEPQDFTQTRVRLNANVNINDSTSAFIQMQSTRTWGQGLATNSASSGNASFTGSDADASVGIHEAYFTLKNFAALPVDLKVGRQQVVLDGHRLFGHTGWTVGAQTHDAMRLTHKHDNTTLQYLWIIANDDGNPANGAPDNLDDVEVHLLHFNQKGMLGGNFSAIYAWVQDGCPNTTTTTADTGTTLAVVTVSCNNLANDSHTIGFRQAGQLFGIDYRGEYYHQFGDATDDAVGTLGTPTGDVDRNAHMIGVRLGTSFKSVMMKPSLTLWYDYLSGTSDADALNNDYKTFDTLFDTGHKFYGLMDQFVGATGAGSGQLGLQDIAIKAKISPMAGWTLKADYHWFFTAESVGANTGIAAGVPLGTSNDLGTELDMTLIHKYNANTKIVIGYSNYVTSPGFKIVNANASGGNEGTDDANWAYVMFDVKF